MGEGEERERGVAGAGESETPGAPFETAIIPRNIHFFSLPRAAKKNLKTW